MSKIITSLREAEELESKSTTKIIIGIVFIVTGVLTAFGIILLIIGLIERDTAVAGKKKFSGKPEDDVITRVKNSVEEGLKNLTKREPKETFFNCDHCGGKNSSKDLKCQHCGAHLKVK